MVVKAWLVSFACLVCAATAGAQAGGSQGTKGPTLVPYKNQKMILSGVTSLGIELRAVNGQDLPGLRHELIASYENRPQTCPPNFQCISLPPSTSATFFFHEWEFQATSSQRREFLFCRRAIESAKPTDKIVIVGDIEFARDIAFVYVHSITSCAIEATAG